MSRNEATRVKERASRKVGRLYCGCSVVDESHTVRNLHKGPFGRTIDRVYSRILDRSRLSRQTIRPVKPCTVILNRFSKTTAGQGQFSER